jgi:hypothetical protein
MTAEGRICVYAIAEAGVPAKMRVLGRSLLALEAGNLALIAERDRGDHQVSEERLRRQHAIVEALAASIDPILPVRFGTTGSADDLKTRVIASGAVLGAALDHVRGMKQMTVRIRPSGPPRDPAPPESGQGLSGREYLEQRRTEHASLTAAARAITSAAGALVADERVAPGPPPRGAIFHLIRRGDVDAYRRIVESCAVSPEAVTVVVSGPFAPFAFVPQL